MHTSVAVSQFAHLLRTLIVINISFKIEVCYVSYERRNIDILIDEGCTYEHNLRRYIHNIFQSEDMFQISNL